MLDTRGRDGFTLADTDHPCGNTLAGVDHGESMADLPCSEDTAGQ